MDQEKKRKRISHKELLATEPRCVYCPNTDNLTLEHMPPRSMFKDSYRPKGMEFAACQICNSGTRGADALAGMVARMSLDDSAWKVEELGKLTGSVAQQASAALDEIANTKSNRTYMLYPDGYYRTVFTLDVKGQAVARHIGAFGAKLGMALFRELTGHALPPDGLVWTHWTFNGAMTPAKLEAMTSIMPAGATLSQGKVQVSEQFYYRYNSDGVKTVAVTAGFHEALWIMAIVSADAEIVRNLRKDTRLQPAAVVQPGGLLELLSGGGPLGYLVTSSPEVKA